MNYSSLILIALMVVAFYFLLIRPQRKRQAAQQNTLRSLQPGTRVMTGSGIFGTIVHMGDKQAVLEVAPGVHLTVLKPAIARAATEADEDTVVDDYDDADGPGVGAPGAQVLDGAGATGLPVEPPGVIVSGADQPGPGGYVPPQASTGYSAPPTGASNSASPTGMGYTAPETSDGSSAVTSDWTPTDGETDPGTSRRGA